MPSVNFESLALNLPTLPLAHFTPQSLTDHLFGENLAGLRQRLRDLIAEVASQGQPAPGILPELEAYVLRREDSYWELRRDGGFWCLEHGSLGEEGTRRIFTAFGPSDLATLRIETPKRVRVLLSDERVEVEVPGPTRVVVKAQQIWFNGRRLASVSRR